MVYCVKVIKDIVELSRTCESGAQRRPSYRGQADFNSRRVLAAVSIRPEGWTKVGAGKPSEQVREPLLFNRVCVLTIVENKFDRYIDAENPAIR